jgi:hypothetical protein
VRKQTAILVISVLTAITAFCPTLFCAPASDAHACCPKHQPSQPHHDTGSQTCPYLLLAKAKSVPLAAVLPPLQTTAIVAPAERPVDIVLTPSRIPNAGDLYLRNRVLLI